MWTSKLAELQAHPGLGIFMDYSPAGCWGLEPLPSSLTFSPTPVLCTPPALLFFVLTVIPSSKNPRPIVADCLQGRCHDHFCWPKRIGRWVSGQDWGCRRWMRGTHRSNGLCSSGISQQKNGKEKRWMKKISWGSFLKTSKARFILGSSLKQELSDRVWYIAGKHKLNRNQ